MDKPQKMHAPNRKCYVCQNETQDCIFADMAYYSKQTCNLVMVSKMACQSCREEIQTVRYYVQQNGLSYGKNSRMFIQNVQPYLSATNQRNQNQDGNSLYQRTLQQQIKRNRIYHEGSLPQNCLQLVYYSSFGISQAQRHEKIKNLIKMIMTVSPINYANLGDVAVLVHCLTCFMSETNTLRVMKTINERILVEGSPFQQQLDEDYEMPVDLLWRNLYEKTHIGNFLMGLSALFRNWPKFGPNFRQISTQRQIVEPAKLLSLLNLKQKSTKNNTTTNNNNNNSNQLCPKCKTTNISHLSAIQQQKNIFSIILKTMVKQQNGVKQQLKQIQQKNNKQKQQYINKIIKLKDKISILQKDHDMSLPILEGDKNLVLQQVKYKQFNRLNYHKRSRSFTQDRLQVHGKYTVKQDKVITQTQQISQASSQHFIDANSMSKFEQNGKTSQTQPSKDNKIDKNIINKLMHKLIAQMKQFDPALLCGTVNIETIVDKIQFQLIQNKQNLLALQKRVVTLDLQSKRLLKILTKKQQRYIPLIHEKDQLIQKYENALWKMQNFLQIDDEVLGPRIQLIINKYQQQFMENLTVADQQLRMDDQDAFKNRSSVPVIKNSASEKNSPVKSTIKMKETKSEKKDKKKIVKKTKEGKKQEERQCVIF